MLTKNRGSSFIRQFGGPGEDSQIVCFRFWQLVVAGGCPYRCAYCFLQTVPWFRFRPDELYGLVYANVEDMEEKDPSGFKYRIPFDTQVEMFRFAINKLKSSIKPALGKEDRALWKALGMKFDGCHGLLGHQDAIVKGRNAEMRQARTITPVIGIGKPLPVLA